MQHWNTLKGIITEQSFQLETETELTPRDEGRLLGYQQILHYMDTVEEDDIDYKRRFITEYRELRNRTHKLGKMIEKYHNGTLEFTPTCPIATLENQHSSMKRYLHILGERAKMEDIDV